MSEESCGNSKSEHACFVDSSEENSLALSPYIDSIKRPSDKNHALNICIQRLSTMRTLATLLTFLSIVSTPQILANDKASAIISVITTVLLEESDFVIQNLSLQSAQPGQQVVIEFSGQKPDAEYEISIGETAIEPFEILNNGTAISFFVPALPAGSYSISILSDGKTISNAIDFTVELLGLPSSISPEDVFDDFLGGFDGLVRLIEENTDNKAAFNESDALILDAIRAAMARVWQQDMSDQDKEMSAAILLNSGLKSGFFGVVRALQPPATTTLGGPLRTASAETQERTDTPECLQVDDQKSPDSFTCDELGAAQTILRNIALHTAITDTSKSAAGVIYSATSVSFSGSFGRIMSLGGLLKTMYMLEMERTPIVLTNLALESQSLTLYFGDEVSLRVRGTFQPKITSQRLSLEQIYALALARLGFQPGGGLLAYLIDELRTRDALNCGSEGQSRCEDLVPFIDQISPEEEVVVLLNPDNEPTLTVLDADYFLPAPNINFTFAPSGILKSATYNCGTDVAGNKLYRRTIYNDKELAESQLPNKLVHETSIVARMPDIEGEPVIGQLDVQILNRAPELSDIEVCVARNEWKTIDLFSQTHFRLQDQECNAIERIEIVPTVGVFGDILDAEIGAGFIDYRLTSNVSNFEEVLTVKYFDGAEEGEATLTIGSSQAPPVAELEIDSTVTVLGTNTISAQSAMFDASMSSGEDSGTLEYKWFVGDANGSEPVWEDIQPANAQYQIDFDETGNKRIWVQVSDPCGANDVASIVVNVVSEVKSYTFAGEGGFNTIELNNGDIVRISIFPSGNYFYTSARTVYVYDPVDNSRLVHTFTPTPTTTSTYSDSGPTELSGNTFLLAF